MKKKVYIIRKSFIDKDSELARCSNFDLAVALHKPGYNIYDENGNLLHVSINENKYGKEWVELKYDIENLILKLELKTFPILSVSDFRAIVRILTKALKMMNKVEDIKEN